MACPLRFKKFCLDHRSSNHLWQKTHFKNISNRSQPRTFVKYNTNALLENEMKIKPKVTYKIQDSFKKISLPPSFHPLSTLLSTWGSWPSWAPLPWALGRVWLVGGICRCSEGRSRNWASTPHTAASLGSCRHLAPTPTAVSASVSASSPCLSGRVGTAESQVSLALRAFTPTRRLPSLLPTPSQIAALLNFPQLLPSSPCARLLLGL